MWEEVRRVHQEGILVDVEHVKAHRSEKEMQEMSFFYENFMTEGNGKADEPAKAEARLDGGDVAQVRHHDAAGTGGGSCSIEICGKLSLSGGGMERKQRGWTKAQNRSGFFSAKEVRQRSIGRSGVWQETDIGV